MPDLEQLPEDWNTALAIVAHPDDLEYGTASAVARWTTQGKKISYLLATRGEAGINTLTPTEAGPLREEEERRSARVVGVDQVEFLGYQDGIVEYGLPLRRDLARAIRIHRPEAIFSISYQLTFPGGFLNMADHRAVGVSILDAARDAGNRWIYPEFLDDGIEPWQGVRMVCFSGTLTPTHATDITDSFHLGVASLAEHRAYIDGLSTDFEPEAFLRGPAEATGELLGCDMAISFEVIWI